MNNVGKYRIVVNKAVDDEKKIFLSPADLIEPEVSALL